MSMKKLDGKTITPIKGNFIPMLTKDLSEPLPYNEAMKKIAQFDNMPCAIYDIKNKYYTIWIDDKCLGTFTDKGEKVELDTPPIFLTAAKQVA